ncbi:D-TA family PLP-dependent enzyme [Compostibacter hankyongensis]|uniref:D-TA family PLP-dependent enzyme n=1 Tax=Compostibacter hankyongensis TaxID=1007089 RepID=A0ABP8G0T2_9BACT
MRPWYALAAPEDTDSPALLVYPERIAANIRTMIQMAGGAARLRPHVKTHKMEAVVKMQLDQGIRKFKCATIAEAEMLAAAGAPDVLLAYQLPLPRIGRLIRLIRTYPGTRFASLIDNTASARLLEAQFATAGLEAQVWIDVDNGMHRSGLPPDDSLLTLYEQLLSYSHIRCYGLHVYDGHIREKEFEKRRSLTEAAFAPVNEILQKIAEKGLPPLQIVAGGTPTFPVHALHPERQCSPGTCLLWDEGYRLGLPEQPFLHAAVLLTRIISKPAPGLLTADLGHKAVAAENPPDRRIFLLNLDGYTVSGQSEEHLVLSVSPPEWERWQTGDVLYGIPYHICPTVALYDEAVVVKEGRTAGAWPVTARGRKLTV